MKKNEGAIDYEAIWGTGAIFLVKIVVRGAAGTSS